MFHITENHEFFLVDATAKAVGVLCPPLVTTGVKDTDLHDTPVSFASNASLVDLVKNKPLVGSLLPDSAIMHTGMDSAISLAKTALLADAKTTALVVSTLQDPSVCISTVQDSQINVAPGQDPAVHVTSSTPGTGIVASSMRDTCVAIDSRVPAVSKNQSKGRRS